MAIKLEITGADAAEFKDQLRGVAEAVLTTSLPGGARLTFTGEDDTEEAPLDAPLPVLGKTHDPMDFIVGQMANTIREDQTESTEATKATRKRRTKAEIEADKAAEAAGESGSSAEVNEDEKSEGLQVPKVGNSHEGLLAELSGAASINELGNIYHAQPERIDNNLALRTAMLTRQHHFTGARGGGNALPGGTTNDMDFNASGAPDPTEVNEDAPESEVPAEEYRAADAAQIEGMVSDIETIDLLKVLAEHYHKNAKLIESRYALKQAYLKRRKQLESPAAIAETAAPAPEVTAPAPAVEIDGDPFPEAVKVTGEQLREYAMTVRDKNGPEAKAPQMVKLQILLADLVSEGILTATQKSFSNVPEQHCAAVLERLKALA